MRMGLKDEGAAGRCRHKGGNGTGILDLEPGLNQEMLSLVEME
jgi:hypothetical protein